METEIPVVSPPHSHCRINSSKLLGSAAEPTSPTGKHKQAGQAGRGEAEHRHGALCSSSYSTTSPYLFLLTGGATFSLSSRLGRFSATERTRSLDPQLSWCVCQGWAENHRALVKHVTPLQLGLTLGAQGKKEASSCGNLQVAAVLVPLQLCPPYRVTKVCRGLLPLSIPLASSFSSSKQALRSGSREPTKQEGQQAEASAPAPSAPFRGTREP